MKGRALSGDIPARGDIPGSDPGGREGVSSHCGKVCPTPTTHKPISKGGGVLPPPLPVW